MATTTQGTFIVVEGLDRAGKTTQSQRLATRLKAEGKCVELLRFPNRTSPIGQMINNYLQGKSEIEDHVVHLLFSANRWEFAREIESKIGAGTTIIADRYIHSGMVYSAAKENPNLSLEWARTPDIGLPKPDLVIFLDLAPEKARARGGFGEEVYEKEAMQKKVRDLFLHIQQDEGERIVTVDAGKEVEEVEAAVWSCVETAIEQVQTRNTGLKTDVIGKWTDRTFVDSPK